jgi:hypothetical protein
LDRRVSELVEVQGQTTIRWRNRRRIECRVRSRWKHAQIRRRLRVAARLIRADNGVIIWSESYDRPWGEMLTTQDDIAAEIATALRASIDSAAAR